MDAGPTVGDGAIDAEVPEKEVGEKIQQIFDLVILFLSRNTEAIISNRQGFVS